MCRSSKRGYFNCLYNNKENDKPSQGYNIGLLKLYKCIVGLQLKYYIQVVIARNRTWKTDESANKELDVCKVTEYLYSTLNSRHLQYIRGALLWFPMNMSCVDKFKRCGLTILNRSTGRPDYKPSIEKCKLSLEKKQY